MVEIGSERTPRPYQLTCRQRALDVRKRRDLLRSRQSTSSVPLSPLFVLSGVVDTALVQCASCKKHIGLAPAQKHPSFPLGSSVHLRLRDLDDVLGEWYIRQGKSATDGIMNFLLLPRTISGRAVSPLGLYQGNQLACLSWTCLCKKCDGRRQVLSRTSRVRTEFGLREGDRDLGVPK